MVLKSYKTDELDYWDDDDEDTQWPDITDKSLKNNRTTMKNIFIDSKLKKQKFTEN